MSKLLLIDGSNVLHRAFHALPLLHNEAGRYTNGAYGFLTMLQKIMEREQPTHIAVCFDKGKSTFRHRQFLGYKAKRQETPAELSQQFPLIQEILTLRGILTLEMEEYEADDIIGTLAKLGQENGSEVLVLSGDKDLLQLIDRHVTVLAIKKGISDVDAYDRAAFVERYGIEPPRMVDLKALMGDSSDNIPGVPGVGEKTALKLLLQYGSLDQVYASLDGMPPTKMREKLAANKDLAYLSYELATIVRDIPLLLQMEDLVPKPSQTAALANLYRELGFKSLLKNLPAAESPGLSLFPETKTEAAYAFQIPIDRDAFLAACLEQPRIAVYHKDAYYYIGDSAGHVVSVPEADALVLTPLFCAATVEKISYQIKEYYHLGKKTGVEIAGKWQDMELVAYLLEAIGSNYGPEELLRHYLAMDSSQWPQEDVDYAVTAAFFPLFAAMSAKLEEIKALALYNEIELPLARILANMEWAGVRVDREKLREMSKELDFKITALQEQVYFMAGEVFNLNSPKQLQEILFGKMGLRPLKKTKTGYSTDNEVLESLANFSPIVEKILSYRQLSKLKSTYTDALDKLIQPETGHIHSKFNQTVTATGRLSSTEPNLQNIPIRQAEGREIRKAFTASLPAYRLLAADYSQIELRILAHYSQDPVLMEAFRNNEDIHTRTAAEIFHIKPEAVDSEMRRKAKAVNFGIIYGISDYGLGRDLGISRTDAKYYIDNYFLRYPSVGEFLHTLIQMAREEGYVETLLGRRRYLPDIKSKNFNLRSFAERTAMNTPLQGSAADIIKAAMVTADKKIKEAGLKSRLVLQVHDELIFDCPQEELETMIPLVRTSMEETVSLRVPLIVDMKAGYDWYDMEKLE